MANVSSSDVYHDISLATTTLSVLDFELDIDANNAPTMTDMAASSHSEESMLLRAILLAALLLLKVVGHFSISVISQTPDLSSYSPKAAASANKTQSRAKILHVSIFLLTQLCIGKIHGLYATMHWSLFYLLGAALAFLMLHARQQALLWMALIELFWLTHCGDISCIAAFIFSFEGLFVQRLKEELPRQGLSWWLRDRHLVCFVLCKVCLVGWILMRLSWVASLCETLYFVIPILSLNCDRWRLDYDAWFFVDGCSHVSFFCLLCVVG